MSRTTARTRRMSAHTEGRSGATPVWVWIVYAVGALAGLLVVGSAIVSAVLVLLSDAVIGISLPALLVCLVLAVAAGGLMLWRRRGGA